MGCFLYECVIFCLLRYFFIISDGNFGTEEVECASTRAEAGAWWMVDTGRIHRISHVAITNVRGPDGNLKVLKSIKLKTVYI